jgi:hypothetical protein
VQEGNQAAVREMDERIEESKEHAELFRRLLLKAENGVLPWPRLKNGMPTTIKTPWTVIRQSLNLPQLLRSTLAPLEK